MAKMSYTEIATFLREASTHCLERSGSFATITGTYEYMLADLVANMPAHKQNEFVRNMSTTRSYINAVYTPTPSMGIQESS